MSQAASEAGVHYALGYSIRNRPDVANCIQKLIDKSVSKYGFDATEIMERTKEIVDFDPLMVMNPDGTFTENLADVPAEARRNIKKMKVKNLYNDVKDMNGIESKIIVGKVVEYEFYDKLKAAEMAGREKDLFNTRSTVKHEHTVSDEMANVLLESSRRGEQASLAFKNTVIETEAEVVDNE